MGADLCRRGIPVADAESDGINYAHERRQKYSDGKINIKKGILAGFVLRCSGGSGHWISRPVLERRKFPNMAFYFALSGSAFFADERTSAWRKS